MILVVVIYDAVKTSIPTRIQDCCRQRQRQYSRSSHRRLFPNFPCKRLPDVPLCLSLPPTWHLNISMQSNIVSLALSPCTKWIKDGRTLAHVLLNRCGSISETMQDRDIVTRHRSSVYTGLFFRGAFENVCLKGAL